MFLNNIVSFIILKNSPSFDYSEATEIAVSIFNQQNLLRHLLPCLNPESHGYNIAVAAGESMLYDLMINTMMFWRSDV